MPTYVWSLFTVPPVPPGSQTQRTSSAIQDAKASLLVDTAEGNYLSIIGQNYGVPRPRQSVSDDLYRRLVQVLAWQPKAILFTVYKLLEAVFGSQATIIAGGDRPWRVYEVNANEIIIELPVALISANQETASYLHGWSGYAHVPSGPTNTFTTPGDITSAAGVTLVGMDLHVLISGTWTTYQVTSASYNSETDTSTVVVNAATLPAGGGLFYLEVPGDDIASYRGDYLATGGAVSTYSTTAGPNTNTIQVLGDVTSHVSVGHDVVLSYSGGLHTYVVSSISYNVSTNLTTVVMTTSTIPGGLSGEAFLKELEKADTASTPDHDDRVYLTGLGAYEIVGYYMDLLVRAAGIVVRIEQI